jgi:hypothetical protein
MAKRKKVPLPFRFPRKPHRRVHGPLGHKSYQAYKPWLRDEFEFRCVYCLTRERWRDDGYNSFTIDHVKPKSSHARLACDYDNLVYACSRCNTLKSVKLGLPDPCRMSLARHLKQRSGYFVALTPVGRRLIEYLRLNSTERVEYRRFFLAIFDKSDRLSPDELVWMFGYPANLPDLSKFKPPRGNSRPAGIAMSHFARQKADKLPSYY